MPQDRLIQRAREGDPTAFDRLIESHREAMFRYAYLIVDDPAAAEDVTQEAVLRIYRQFHRFDPERAFRPWALQITRNLARNHNRSWGRYKHMLQRFLTSRYRDAIDIEALTQVQQRARLLHDAVRQLKADYQDVLYARFFLELPVEECAAVLGVAEGTVKSRTYRALRQLKAIIEKDYPQLKQEAQGNRVLAVENLEQVVVMPSCP